MSLEFLRPRRRASNIPHAPTKPGAGVHVAVWVFLSPVHSAFNMLFRMRHLSRLLFLFFLPVSFFLKNALHEFGDFLFPLFFVPRHQHPPLPKSSYQRMLPHFANSVSALRLSRDGLVVADPATHSFWASITLATSASPALEQASWQSTSRLWGSLNTVLRSARCCALTSCKELVLASKWPQQRLHKASLYCEKSVLRTTSVSQHWTVRLVSTPHLLLLSGIHPHPLSGFRHRILK